MLNWWANLLSRVDLIACDDTCIGLDKIPLELGVKGNKEPAQVILAQELLSGKEINTGIPQGVGPNPLKHFHLFLLLLLSFYIIMVHAKEVWKYYQHGRRMEYQKHCVALVTKAVEIKWHLLGQCHIWGQELFGC